MTTPGRVFRRQNSTRRSRPALAVIPNPTIIISPVGDAVAVEVTPMDNVLNSRYGVESRRNSAPSPDELVIQKRGRRRRTIVWSPDIDSRRDSMFSLSSLDRTPVKSPTKTGLMLHGMPRKRLMLDDNDSSNVTPEKRRLGIYVPSEEINEKSYNDDTNLSKLKTSLCGLSQDQLVKIIVDLVRMHDESVERNEDKLSDILIKNMPVPDMQPFREQLGTVKQNIFASLISLEGADTAFNRAYLHLDNFHRTIVKQGNTLVASEHWFAVMQYVLFAWDMSKELPEWESQEMESTTRKCFLTLSKFCMMALKNGTFSYSTLEHYEKRINMMQEDFDGLNGCLKLIMDIKHCHL